MKIQVKLLLFAVLCSALPLLGTFIFSFNSANSYLTKVARDNLASQAAEELDSLQHELASAKHDLGTLSRLSSMQQVATGDYEGSLQHDLESFAMRTPLYAEIVVADFNGIVVAGTSTKYTGNDFSGTWEFEAPKLGINFDGRVVKSYRLNKRVATQSVPLYSSADNNNIIGALIGSIDWEHLQKQMSLYNVFHGRQSQQRQVFLESMESESILYNTPGVVVPTQLLADASPDNGIKQVSLNGISYNMLTLSTRPYNNFRDPRWRLHVLLDTELIYASTQHLKNYFLLAAGLVSLLVLSVGTMFGRSIVRPVKSLVIGAQRWSAGDYEYEIPAKSNRDEIGQLTHSFKSMRIAVRRKEQELVAKTELAEQAARLKGEFLANMSHEVRTPINGVLGMTELLLNTSLDEQQSRYAKTISRSGQSLLAVINDILDFSKIEAGKLELSNCVFDLRELVEDVVEMVADNAQRKGVEVALHMPPESHVSFNGDGARIRQVLLNLLSNAIKFTSKGEVNLFVAIGPAEQGMSAIAFKVVDTGIGIEDKNLEKIFDSFVQADGTTTREFGGTGLGLAISTKLVKLMGGEFGVNSRVGQGSTFWFDIKLERIVEAVESAWRKPDSLAGKRILIVGDNQTNREILETQLVYWGAEPIISSSAMEALHEITASASSEDKPDVIILELNMPVMNGLELAEIIKKKQLVANVKIVLLSSAFDSQSFPADHNNGVHYVVNKPVRQSDLYNCLTAAIGSQDIESVAANLHVERIESAQLSGRILLAEDNPVNQEMMHEMLSLIGLTVELANDGAEVLHKLEQYEFDLILMDCQMPVLDGFATTYRIREQEAQLDAGVRLPIIALTANALQGDEQRCLDAGMDGYLSKPVSSRQLADTLGAWLDPIEASGSSPMELSLVGTQGNGAQSVWPEFIDDAVFTELLNMCDKAPAGFYSRLVHKFDISSSEDLRLLQEAIETNNAELVGSVAHRLKSGSTSWGAQNLTKRLINLELAGKGNELANAAELVEQVKFEHQQLLEFLRVQESRAA